MNFQLQVSNPQPSACVNADDSTLGEAVESMYPLDTEFAVLVWNHVYVPLSYKYDISVIVDDVIYMLQSIMETDEGHLTIDWPSNTFQTRWDLAWNATEVNITARWDAVIGGTEGLLNSVPHVMAAKSHFLREWEPLLRRISESVQECAGAVDTSPILASVKAVLARLSESEQR